MKYQFKDSHRVFWYITYECDEGAHVIKLQNEGGKDIIIHFCEDREPDDMPLSINEIMMTIANEFAMIGLRFANGVQDVHPVEAFYYEKK